MRLKLLKAIIGQLTVTFVVVFMEKTAKGVTETVRNWEVPLPEGLNKEQTAEYVESFEDTFEQKAAGVLSQMEDPEMAQSVMRDDPGVYADRALFGVDNSARRGRGAGTDQRLVETELASGGYTMYLNPDEVNPFDHEGSMVYDESWQESTSPVNPSVDVMPSDYLEGVMGSAIMREIEILDTLEEWLGIDSYMSVSELVNAVADGRDPSGIIYQALPAAGDEERDALLAQLEALNDLRVEMNDLWDRYESRHPLPDGSEMTAEQVYEEDRERHGIANFSLLEPDDEMETWMGQPSWWDRAQASRLPPRVISQMILDRREQEKIFVKRVSSLLSTETGWWTDMEVVRVVAHDLLTACRENGISRNSQHNLIALMAVQVLRTGVGVEDLTNLIAFLFSVPRPIGSQIRKVKAVMKTRSVHCKVANPWSRHFRGWVPQSTMRKNRIKRLPDGEREMSFDSIGDGIRSLRDAPYLLKRRINTHPLIKQANERARMSIWFDTKWRVYGKFGGFPMLGACWNVRLYHRDSGKPFVKWQDLAQQRLLEVLCDVQEKEWERTSKAYDYWSMRLACMGGPKVTRPIPPTLPKVEMDFPSPALVCDLVWEKGVRPSQGDWKRHLEKIDYLVDASKRGVELTDTEKVIVAFVGRNLPCQKPAMKPRVHPEYCEQVGHILTLMKSS